MGGENTVLEDHLKQIMIDTITSGDDKMTQQFFSTLLGSVANGTTEELFGQLAATIDQYDKAEGNNLTLSSPLFHNSKVKGEDGDEYNVLTNLARTKGVFGNTTNMDKVTATYYSNGGHGKAAKKATIDGPHKFEFDVNDAHTLTVDDENVLDLRKLNINDQKALNKELDRVFAHIPKNERPKMTFYADHGYSFLTFEYTNPESGTEYNFKISTQAKNHGPNHDHYYGIEMKIKPPPGADEGQFTGFMTDPNAKDLEAHNITENPGLQGLIVADDEQLEAILRSEFVDSPEYTMITNQVSGSISSGTETEILALIEKLETEFGAGSSHLVDELIAELQRRQAVAEASETGNFNIPESTDKDGNIIPEHNANATDLREINNNILAKYPERAFSGAIASSKLTANNKIKEYRNARRDILLGRETNLSKEDIKTSMNFWRDQQSFSRTIERSIDLEDFKFKPVEKARLFELLNARTGFQLQVDNLFKSGNPDKSTLSDLKSELNKVNAEIMGLASGVSAEDITAVLNNQSEDSPIGSLSTAESSFEELSISHNNTAAGIQAQLDALDPSADNYLELKADLEDDLKIYESLSKFSDANLERTRSLQIAFASNPAMFLGNDSAYSEFVEILSQRSQLIYAINDAISSMPAADQAVIKALIAELNTVNASINQTLRNSGVRVASNSESRGARDASRAIARKERRAERRAT
jgi:hypothetical protein